MRSRWPGRLALVLLFTTLGSLAGGCAGPAASRRPEGRAVEVNISPACSEASPDVAGGVSASPEEEAEIQALVAAAGAAGAVERTQTMNLLRESMYRTCERYLSGAIDHMTYLTQAGRDRRAMIAIMAIEQLTRQGR